MWKRGAGRRARVSSSTTMDRDLNCCIISCSCPRSERIFHLVRQAMIPADTSVLRTSVKECCGRRLLPVSEHKHECAKKSGAVGQNLMPPSTLPTLPNLWHDRLFCSSAVRDNLRMHVWLRIGGDLLRALPLPFEGTAWFLFYNFLPSPV